VTLFLLVGPASSASPAFSDSASQFSGSSGEDGAFLFTGVPPGTYGLRAKQGVTCKVNPVQSCTV